MKQVLNFSEDVHWKLQEICQVRVMDTNRWFDLFSQVQRELDFEGFAGVPPVFKHRQKLMAINVHLIVRSPSFLSSTACCATAAAGVAVPGPLP